MNVRARISSTTSFACVEIMAHSRSVDRRWLSRGRISDVEWVIRCIRCSSWRGAGRRIRWIAGIARWRHSRMLKITSHSSETTARRCVESAHFSLLGNMNFLTCIAFWTGSCSCKIRTNVHMNEIAMNSFSATAWSTPIAAKTNCRGTLRIHQSRILLLPSFTRIRWKLFNVRWRFFAAWFWTTASTSFLFFCCVWI